MQDHDKDLDNDFDDADFMEVDDDLGDDLDYLDDVDDMDSGDWDDEEFDTGQDDQPQKKKKSLGTNTIVIIAAVVIGAGVMLWQFAQPEPDQLPEDAPFQSALSPQGQVNNPVTAPARQAQQEREERENVSQEGGFLVNPSEIDSIQTTEPSITMDDGEDLMGDLAPPMPAPIASSPESVEDGSLMPMPDVASDTDNATNVLDSPLNETELSLLRAPETDNTDTAQEEVMGAAELLESKIAERQEDSGNNISEVTAPLEENIEDTSTIIEEPALDVELDVSMPLAITSTDTEVSSDIQSLEEELEATRSELEEVRTSSSQEITSLNAEIERLKAQLESKSVVQQPKVTEKAPIQAKPKPRAQQRRSWELRAAMPGKAWVSQKGQSEMRSVVVGDSLSGVGRVTAITYNNGLWLVEGTQGQIRQ